MDIEEEYNKIYRYCYFKLYDKQLAEDITQETFLRFYKQELCFDSSKELPYLYAIAKSLCIDAFRRKTEVSLENIDEALAYDPSEEWAERLTLQAYIAKLSHEEQEIIFLKYVNEIPIMAHSLFSWKRSLLYAVPFVVVKLATKLGMIPY